MEVDTSNDNVGDTIAQQDTKTNDIVENGESPETMKKEEAFATPTASVPTTLSDTPSSTPDLTPSRRSSRKKQSTFSSDFEYYTPGGRKIVAVDEDKQNATASKLTPKAGKNGQTGEADKTGIMQRKVAIRTKKGKKGKSEEPEATDDNEASPTSPELKSKKTKLKATVIKPKGIKGRKKIAQETDTKKGKRNILNKTLKRKKAAIKTALGKNKKAKVEKIEEEEESSDEDEEESTPISQLKAQMAASKANPAKVGVQQIATSPLAKNLMHKLKQASEEVLSSPESLEVIKKRKRAKVTDTTSDDGDEEIPLKKLQLADDAHKEKGVGLKREPVLAGLMKRSPPDDTGLVKRTASEMAVKLGASSKTVNCTDTSSDGVGVKAKKVKQENEGANTTSASEKIHTVQGEGQSKVKQEDGAVKSVKKEVKKEPTSKTKGDKDKTGLPVKEVKVKKDTDVIKTVKRTITTSDGRVINAVVKVYRNGRKVMTVNGREKVLNPGKSKETTASSKSAEKSEEKAKSKSSDQEVPLKKDSEKLKKDEHKAQSKEHGKKTESKQKSNQKVDDLLKRGPRVKKKSHQPFGNKNTVSKHHKLPHDSNEETTAKSSAHEKKMTSPKAGDKKERKRSQEGERKKGTELEKRRRSSSESSKSHVDRERGHSTETSKSERKKSIDGGKKVTSGQKLKEGDTKDEDLPTLVPISAMAKQHKHKHPKPEHEVPMDMTMNDLFKPDGLIVLDKAKKEENVTSAEECKKGPAHDPDSPIKPQNLPNVLIEHRYSKPSSPAHHDTRDELSIGLQQQDIDSVSHHTSSVAVDANLPDQFMEESSGQEPDGSSQIDGTGGLQQFLNKEKLGIRSSILESLDTELKEGGSEFVIVGQVEIGRPTVVKSVEDVSETVTVSSSNDDLKEKESSITSSKSEQLKHMSDDTNKAQKSRKDSGEFKRKKEKRKETKSEEAEDEDEEDEEGFVDDENDDDWEPNDPNTLYCICQKPHGNRFMICCDKCEEWYHGSCVGISKARGKEMDDNEEEYICLVCQKGEATPNKAVDVLSSKSNEKSQSPSTKSKLIQKCVGRKCSKTPRPGSVYCSNECIMSHAQDSLKAIREDQYKKKLQEKEKSKQPSSKDVKPGSKISTLGDTVAVVETETGKIIQGLGAPTHKNLRQWLEDHPTFQVLNVSKHRSSSSKDSKHRDSHSSRSGDKEKHREKDAKSFYGDKSRRDSKESTKKIDGERRRSSSSSKSEGSSLSSSSSSSSKSGDRNDDGPNQVRLNVRTALRDSLSARANGADDIMLSSTEIKNLALTIEEELFAYFKDTGHKYRTKYRSLIFNIKDQKNKGLFRKILTGKIKPSKLVQMSTEELASRELAKWREKESKHQLEMIEQTEKEALKESLVSKHVRKKTHKGEVEVEEEDLSILETTIEEKKDNSAETNEENIQVPVIDTTDQHRAHLFDLNCKVCTGKIVPGPEEQAVAKKQVTFSLQASSTRIISDDEQTAEQTDFDKAEEIVREAMLHVQKTEEEVASSSSMVSSPSPKEELPPLSPELDLPLSPKNNTTRNESSSSSSSSSASIGKKVIVRSPDSALQSGLEVKAKFTPTGPLLWKGFVSMLDVAKFFTSAYRVSGPTEHITMPDTVHIMGRISPDHMWDYLSKIRQAGSKDLTVLRFIPGSDDEKVAYVHLYSYLNSRGRCGVVNNPNKQIKDFYVVPLASHSKIPRTLLPFDGPGLEENRPHMLIGILVQQRGKHSSSDQDSSGKNSSSDGSTVRSSPSIKSSNKHKSSRSSSDNSGNNSSSSSSIKKTGVNRDPRLAKLAAKKDSSPQASPGSSSSTASNSQVTTPKALEDKRQEAEEDIYEPEYIPMPVKAKVEPVAEYVPTAKKKESEGHSEKKEKKSDESSDKHHCHHHHHHHHTHHHSQGQHHQPHSHHQHHHTHQEDKNKIEDDSDPYSPGKEAEPYSPSREAEADEPYDPGDESLMDETGVPITSTSTLSTTTKPASFNSTQTNEMKPGTSSVLTSHLDAEKTSSSNDSKSVLPASMTESFSIEDCVEKMACSNNPSEISSLMVAALSTASSPEEQQTLLVDLTKRVEERKIQLAQMSRKGDGTKKPIGEGSVSSTSATHESSVLTPRSDDSPSAGSNFPKEETSIVSKESFSVSSSTEATLSEGLVPIGNIQMSKEQVSPESSSLLVSSTSSLKSQPNDFQGLNTFEKDHSSNAKANLPKSENQHEALYTSKEQTSTDELPFLGNISVSPKPLSTDIPDALKALIEDVKGNTEAFSLERRRKALLKREAMNSGGDVDKATEAKNIKEVPVTSLSDDSALSEAQRKVQDELEARKILEELNESEKAIGMPGGVKKEEVPPSGSAGDAQEGAKNTSSTSEKVPTIDELLEKLKKGGFKFPIEKNTVSASSSSPSVTSETPTVLSSTTDIKGMNSNLDIDLRTSSTPSSISNLTFTPTPTPSDTMSLTISSSGGDSPVLPIQDSDQRKQGLNTPAMEQDQGNHDLYQDRDERVFQPKPKHPHDPRTFSTVPSESHSHPPHALEPLNLPSTQYPPPQGDPFQGRPLAPKGRAQPPPPGTEFEESSEPLDVDMRNLSGPRPPLPPEQAPPPLPPQPPPPLPPLPGNHSQIRDYPHYPPHDLPMSDVDFRSHEQHRPPVPPPPHHHHHIHTPHHHPRHPPPHPSDNWYHDRGRDPDYRGYSGRGRGAPSFRRH